MAYVSIIMFKHLLIKLEITLKNCKGHYLLKFNSLFDEQNEI